MTILNKFHSISIFAFALILFTSCESNDSTQQEVELTETEAVEIIESSFQSNQGGITSNLEDVSVQTVTASGTNDICDYVYEDSIEKEHQGAFVQASYISDFVLDVTCNGFGIPQSSTFDITTTSDVTTPNLVSENNSTFTGIITGLQPIAPSYILNGNYNRTGSQELDLEDPKSITSTFIIDLTNIELSKQDYMIQSGSGSFTLSGSTMETTFSYNGTIVFNGNKTATITIAGEVFEIDWN